MWNLKRDTDDLIYKTEIDSQTENKLVVIQGKRGGGINWEFGINIYTLLYVKQINNKDLLYNIGNYIQHLITNIMKRIIYLTYKQILVTLFIIGMFWSCMSGLPRIVETLFKVNPLNTKEFPPQYSHMQTDLSLMTV